MNFCHDILFFTLFFVWFGHDFISPYSPICCFGLTRMWVDTVLLYLQFPDFKWVLFDHIFKMVVFPINRFVSSEAGLVLWKWAGPQQLWEEKHGGLLRNQNLLSLTSCLYTQMSDLFVLLYTIFPGFVLFRLDDNFGNYSSISFSFILCQSARYAFVFFKPPNLNSSVQSCPHLQVLIQDTALP